MQTIRHPACTCYLLRKLARQVTQVYERELRPTGLSLTQYSILRALERQPEGVSVSRLAEIMGMERTALLRTLKPLLAAGWARYGERAAGRSAELEITAKGERKIEAAHASWEAAQQRVAGTLGAESHERLQAALKSSLRALEP
jgi:DNA-binding MarR family transcriptional regulator